MIKAILFNFMGNPIRNGVSRGLTGCIQRVYPTSIRYRWLGGRQYEKSCTGTF